MVRRYQQFLFGFLAGLCATVLLLIIARRPAGYPVKLAPAPTAQPLRIYISGAVAAPGVYALPPGSIAQDALNAASGAGEQADLSHLNLAQPLVDGDRLDVPTLAPTGSPASASTPASGAGISTLTPTTAGQKINLNTATAAELDALPGIGPVIAERIVDYRTQHGPFARPEDLMEVSGIGEATFNRIKDDVVVTP
jgi:competence protein ComEA